MISTKSNIRGTRRTCLTYMYIYSTVRYTVLQNLDTVPSRSFITSPHVCPCNKINPSTFKQNAMCPRNLKLYNLVSNLINLIENYKCNTLNARTVYIRTKHFPSDKLNPKDLTSDLRNIFQFHSNYVYKVQNLNPSLNLYRTNPLYDDREDRLLRGLGDLNLEDEIVVDKHDKDSLALPLAASPNAGNSTSSGYGSNEGTEKGEWNGMES